ncbi:MAG: hypothetical protein J07HN6_00628 [Halonotius sp. J07HN6]|nr:MAG: hypothetical protein J07HN6_00628 [Halonotius sp. J07HN6]
MWSPPRWLLVGVALILLASGAFVATTLDDSGPYDRTTVTISDGDTGSTLATVEVRIADTFEKRYTGLSNTSSLDPNEGMLFIHDSEATRGYVMRKMAFPIDIVFIDASGEITTIHHAEPSDDQTFRGSGRYVLELPHHYTTDNDIAVGDQVTIPDEYR